MADRAGSRIVFLLSVGLWAVSTLGLMAAGDLFGMVLVFAGLGAGQGGFQNAYQILILELGPRIDLPMRFAVLNALTSLMGAIGPLAGGLLAERFSYQAVFWVSIALQIVAVATMQLCVDEPRRRRPVL
jgi:MFS family permease